MHSKVYSQFTLEDESSLISLKGKNIIRVCRGTACHVKGSAGLLFALEDELNIKAGETTMDGNFTLEVVSCMGACTIAPAIAVNKDYYGRAQVKDIHRILSRYSPARPMETPSEEIEEQIAGGVE